MEQDKHNLKQQGNWSAPWWRRPLALAMIWSLLLFYGGLIPFDQSWQHLARDGQSVTEVLLAAVSAPMRWYDYPQTYSSSGFSKAAVDLFMNTVLFFPLGCLWMLAWRPRAGFFGGFILAVLCSAGVSWTMEASQAFSVARVVTLNDVLVNTSAALVGALLGVPLRDALAQMSFRGYLSNAGWIHAVYDRLRRLRRTREAKRWVIGLVVLVGLMMAVLLARLIDSGHAAIPFAHQWQQSYDIAAAQLMMAFLGYALVALLVIAMVVRPRARRGWSQALLLMATVSLVPELVRASWLRQSIDLTLPLMAIGTCLTVMALSVSMLHLTRLACRRRSSVPVEHDRRRRQHDYSFGLHR